MILYHLTPKREATLGLRPFYAEEDGGFDSFVYLTKNINSVWETIAKKSMCKSLRQFMTVIYVITVDLPDTWEMEPDPLMPSVCVRTRLEIPKEFFKEVEKFQSINGLPYESVWKTTRTNRFPR